MIFYKKMYMYNKQFRKDHPETIGESDQHFDLDNYKDWLELKLTLCNNALMELTFQVEQYSLGEISTMDYFKDEITLAKKVIIKN